MNDKGDHTVPFYPESGLILGRSPRRPNLRRRRVGMSGLRLFCLDLPACNAIRKREFRIQFYRVTL